MSDKIKGTDQRQEEEPPPSQEKKRKKKLGETFVKSRLTSAAKRATKYHLK